MQHPPPHSWKPLLFAPPQGEDAMPKTLRPSEIKQKTPNLGALEEAETPPPASPLGRDRRSDSYIRIRVVEPPVVPAPSFRGRVELIEAQDLLDELAEDQLALSLSLVRLSSAVVGRPELEARARELESVRDALAVVHDKAIDQSVHRAFMPDAPLSEYLRGVYAWTHAVVRALDQLSEQRHAEPEWDTYRWRIEEAQNFHFADELEEAIDEDLATLFDENEEATLHLAAACDELLERARLLEENLSSF